MKKDKLKQSGQEDATLEQQDGQNDLSKETKEMPEELVVEQGVTPEGTAATQGTSEQPSEAKPTLDLQKKLEEVLAIAEDYKRKWYNVSAEYDNYRKRNATAVAQAYADGRAEAVKKLLPVADNFGYAYDGATDPKTKDGIDKIIKAFNSILLSFGIEELPVTVGSKFDESMAEAIMTVPCQAGEVQNTVKLVLKKGYKQGDKVIRFAQVSVTI